MVVEAVNLVDLERKFVRNTGVSALVQQKTIILKAYIVNATHLF